MKTVKFGFYSTPAAFPHQEVIGRLFGQKFEVATLVKANSNDERNLSCFWKVTSASTCSKSSELKRLAGH